MNRHLLYIWGVRLWLGALLLFGSEILVWINPFALSPVDWLLRGFICTLLATLILDLAVRFRIRDLYDSMALLAIFALLAGLLIAPQVSHLDFPRTLLTRVLGAQGLVGLEMFGLMLVMMRLSDRRMRRLVLPIAAWNGFYLGIWLRWMPVFGTQTPAVALDSALLLAGGVFAVAMTAGVMLRPAIRHITPLDLKLPVVGFLVLVAVLLALMVPVLASGALQTGPLIASLLLVGVSYAILWFRRTESEPMLMQAFLPAQPPSVIWYAAIIGTFLIACVFSYSLPLVGNNSINQLWLMEIGYGAVGALWFPVVAALLAFRAVDVQMRKSEI